MEYITLIFALLLILVLLSGYCCRWEELRDLFRPQKQEDYKALNVVQIYGEGTLVMALLAMYHNESILRHWLFVFLGAILCLVNMYAYRRRDRIGRGVQCYCGFRLTVFLMLAVYSFLDWNRYAVLGSVLCLLLAIGFILSGFRKRYPSLRIYGLALSMISVLKLLLIDITYENSFVLIFGFIGSGILCFAISWIYHYISKKY